MVMSCNIYTCNICYFVNFVTNFNVIPGPAQQEVRNLEIPDRRSAASGMTKGTSEECDARRLRKETVCRPSLPAHPPAIGAVADPDCRGTRHFALLHQPDRAQPAPGDGADPAP